MPTPVLATAADTEPLIDQVIALAVALAQRIFARSEAKAPVVQDAGETLSADAPDSAALTDQVISRTARAWQLVVGRSEAWVWCRMRVRS
jgi:hypothetical protein